MKTTPEYEHDEKAQQLTQELTDHINGDKILIPVLDLHTYDEENKKHHAFIKMTDKDGNSSFLCLNDEFIAHLSKGITASKAKFEMYASENQNGPKNTDS